MIEFTKEELEMIRDDLEGQMSTHRIADNEFIRNMLKKTKSLIDNYCAHELTTAGYCKKCHRKI